jgi:hypothetical protein
LFQKVNGILMDPIKHVVVKLYLPVESIPQSWSLDQIDSARAHGCSVGGYVWCYRSEDPTATVNSAIDLAVSAGVDLPILWLDCETYTVKGVVKDTGPDTAWLRQAVAACVNRGVRAGVYSGSWWIEGWLKNYAEFTGLPLWSAQYNHVDDLDSVIMPLGWPRESLAGHQYASDVVDLSVFDSTFTGS